MDPIDASTRLWALLKDGGWPAVALVSIAYLYWKNQGLTAALIAEKDAHRVTAIGIAPLTTDMIRIVERLERRRNVPQTRSRKNGPGGSENPPSTGGSSTDFPGGSGKD